MTRGGPGGDENSPPGDPPYPARLKPLQQAEFGGAGKPRLPAAPRPHVMGCADVVTRVVQVVPIPAIGQVAAVDLEPPDRALSRDAHAVAVAEKRATRRGRRGGVGQRKCVPPALKLADAGRVVPFFGREELTDRAGELVGCFVDLAQNAAPSL